MFERLLAPWTRPKPEPEPPFAFIDFRSGNSISQGYSLGFGPLGTVAADDMLEITRAQIPSYTVLPTTVMVMGFSTLGDFGAGAIYTKGVASGPMPIQNAAGEWYNIVLNAPINAGYAGVKGDCYQSAATITTTIGSISATLSSADANIVAGHTLVIDGVGNLIIATIAGTAITFQSPAAASGAGKKFIYGTDDTAALNTFFDLCLRKGAIGVLPPKRYLITATVGVLEPGSSAGEASLTLICGGAGLNTMDLNALPTSKTCSLVWGGAQGGTMVQFSRVAFINVVGGLALVGQSFYRPGGVATFFGPRAGLGWHMSQNATPWVGTGYMNADSLIFMDMDQGMQFASDIDDNNCDTTIINRMIFWRCSNGLNIKHKQGLAFLFKWVYGVAVPGYVIKSEGGGAVEMGSVHLNASGTASADATLDTYSIDVTSSLSGHIFKINLLRLENTSIRAVAARAIANVQIDMFNEANDPNTDKTLFYLEGGSLQINGGRIASYKNAGETTFYLNKDAASKMPRLLLNQISLPRPNDWSKMFTININTIIDVSIVAPRDLNLVAYEDRHTRLERGRILVGGQTTDATTDTQLDPMMRLGGSSWPYSYGPRIPKGLSVVKVCAIGDHGTTTSSVFKRRYTLFRDSSDVCTVVNTETIGADIVAGTDQLFSFSVQATYLTLLISVKGTAATTINWRAVFELESVYAASPDY